MERTDIEKWNAAFDEVLRQYEKAIQLRAASLAVLFDASDMTAEEIYAKLTWKS